MQHITGPAHAGASALPAAAPALAARPRGPAPQGRHAAAHQAPLRLLPAAPSAAPRAAARGAAPRAAAAPEQPAAVSPTQGTPEWHALVANAEWWFGGAQNEALAEQLRELRRYYEEQGRELDFFFVSEPAWLDARFPAQAKLVKRPCVALVSTDKVWITFMKLRLDRVLKLELGPLAIDEATASGGPVPEIKPPANWTAPYSPYAKGWWEAFMRK